MNHSKDHIQALQNYSNDRSHKWEDEIAACYGKPVGPRRSKIVAFSAAVLIPLLICIIFTAIPFWLLCSNIDWWTPLIYASLPAYFFIWLDDVMKRIYLRTQNGYSWGTIIWKGFAGGPLSGGTGGVTFIWRS